MKSRIDLFNTSFLLHSDEDNEYIQSLVSLIKTKALEISNDIDTQNDQLKNAILTLLLMAHELQTIKNDQKSNNNAFNAQIHQLLGLLETNVNSS